MFEGNRVVAHTRSRYPIFQSPMTWIARAPLVSAVSAAGGMGLLENSIADLAVTTREFAAIRAATNQPFGVNLPVRYLQANPEMEKKIIDWLLGQGIHCKGSKLLTTSANGGPAVGIYHAAGNGAYEPWAIVVVETSGGRIAGLHHFLYPEIFPEFGRPARLQA